MFEVAWPIRELVNTHFFNEVSIFVENDKGGILPSGRVLGHEIHWTIKDQSDSLVSDIVIFGFKNEEDKVKFILQWM